MNDLEKFVYDRTWGADFNSPHWCHVIVESICDSRKHEQQKYTVIKARCLLMRSVLDYLGKDSYFFDIWYTHLQTSVDAGKLDVDIASKIEELLLVIMEDSGCSKAREVLYNYSD